MKRVLTCLLAICIGYMANAQVQTKFWGLEISQQYASLSQAKRIISERCEYSAIEDNCILGQKGTFGGYEWDFANFYFHQEGLEHTLYLVVFQSYHKSREAAREKYQSLSNALTQKYGISPNTTKEVNGESSMWDVGDSRYNFSLHMEQSESQGKEMLWYVHIGYYDIDLLIARKDQSENEL